MKCIILAGGLGTRISEETHLRPKPMIEIGGRPILWHVMKIYAAHGIRDFIICAGYKGYMIKEYFANYFLHMSDVTFDMTQNRVEVHEGRSEPWRVTVVDTGEDTMTGGRLRRVRRYLGDETFCFTYGDGVSDVNVGTLLKFHRRHGLRATITAVQRPGRFGAIRLGPRGQVKAFEEKPQGDGAWINGGFFVLEPAVVDLIAGDETIWEREPLEKLTAAGQIAAYKHRGFWQPMDTLREKTLLEDLWSSGKAPWKLW
jgi:glucose-1-phosphate cytidylyltransferase